MQLKSLDKASELFDKADTNGDGKLQVQDLDGSAPSHAVVVDRVSNTTAVISC